MTLRWEPNTEGGSTAFTGVVVVGRVTPLRDGRATWDVWSLPGLLTRVATSGLASDPGAARAAAEAAWGEWCQAAGLAPLGADGWRDIATAPRDGMPVLVAVAGGDFCAAQARWDNRRGCWTWPCEVHGPGLDPTHWRPLPPPPGAAP